MILRANSSLKSRAPDRKGNEDKSKIIFLTSQRKHIL